MMVGASLVLFWRRSFADFSFKPGAAWGRLENLPKTWGSVWFTAHGGAKLFVSAMSPVQKSSLLPLKYLLVVTKWHRICASCRIDGLKRAIDLLLWGCSRDWKSTVLFPANTSAWGRALGTFRWGKCFMTPPAAAILPCALRRWCHFQCCLHRCKVWFNSCWLKCCFAFY